MVDDIIAAKRARANELARLRRKADPEKYRAKDKAERLANPEAAKAKALKWRTANLERAIAASREYKKKNVERLKDYAAAYRLAHAEDALRYAKGYRLANLDVVKAKKKARYVADGEAARQYSREWYARNAEAAKATHAAWFAANPRKRAEYETRRRARKAGADGDHTIDDVLAIGEAQGWKCHWCSKSVRKRYHVDHIIPLSKGGGNGPRNLCITCQPCNQSKHAKDPIDWARQLGRLL